MDELLQRIAVLENENLLLKQHVEELEKTRVLNEDITQVIIDSIPNPLFVKNEDFKHVIFNKAYTEILNLSFKDVILRSDADFFSEEQTAKFREEDNYVLSSGEVLTIEENVEIGQKQMGTFLTSKVRIKDSENRKYVLGLVTDISEKKEHQTLIEKRNIELEKEKRKVQVLLQEVNHRVKNNLQVITSLLSLQLREVKNEESYNVITDCQNRITAIAKVHELLYQRKNVSEIPLGDYIETLINNLILTLKRKNEINLSYNLKNISSKVSIAIPLGMIVNEIVTNSMKHCADCKALNIYVSMTMRKDACLLEIGDDGAGEAFDLKSFSSNMGRELIELFCSQIEAKLSTVEKETGVHYLIEIPIAQIVSE